MQVVWCELLRGRRHGVVQRSRTAETATVEDNSARPRMVGGNAHTFVEKAGRLGLDEGWPLSSAQKWLEEGERLRKLPTMVERSQDFTDTGSIELTEQEAERLTELMMHVRFSVSLKSARFNCDKNTTVIMGRPVQVSFFWMFSCFVVQMCCIISKPKLYTH